MPNRTTTRKRCGQIDALHPPIPFVIKILLAAVIAATLDPSLATAQAPSSQGPGHPTEMYIPAPDLETILGMEKRGVLLPRAQFEELLKKAAENARQTPDIPNGIAVVGADYQAHIVGSQLVIAATVKLNQVIDGWRFLRLPLAGLVVESATLDGKPALLGAGAADHKLRLFSDHRGPHTLLFEAATQLVASGGDRAAVFRLGDLPLGTLTLEVGANQRLFVGGQALERPSPLDKSATYSFPVGGSAEIRLRLTDRSLEQASDRMLFAETSYQLNVAFGDADWQAVTALDARGAAVEHLSIAMPAGLRITTVESVGLDTWRTVAAVGDKPATLELSFRQAFTGPRVIHFRGVLSPGADRHWRLDPLKVAGVTAHVGRIKILHPPDLRLRIDSATNLRTGGATSPGPADPFVATPQLSELQPNANARKTLINPIPNDSGSLYYDFWNEQFSLAFSVETKQREILAELLTALEVSPSGLELQLAASLESLYGPISDVEVTLPADWSPTAVLVDGRPADWRELSAEAGTQHLLMTLPKPSAPGTRVSLTLAAQKSIATWPIDEAGIELALPEVRVLNAAAVNGSYVIRAGEDFELNPLDIKGLDPAHLKLERERIGFRYQDTRFTGRLKIARRPARLSAETVLVAHLDRAALRTLVRTAIEARGGGFRRLDIFLPESVGKDLRFQTDSGDVPIADQSVSEPAHGERHWTLVFANYVQGVVHLQALVDTPRGDAKEFRVPEPRLEGVVRHKGTIVAQAAPDQQLHVTAVGADNQPLAEVDRADLPPIPNQGEDRTVAAYRFVQSGNRVMLVETRFPPIGVARAVCTRCDIETIVPQSGECQHRATLRFEASGVQSLRVALPAGADLWATLIDNQPVEVRRGQSGYELPLRPAEKPDAERVLALFYATPVSAAHQVTEDQPQPDAADTTASDASDSGPRLNPRFRQAPPEVSVLGSGGTPERMEMLRQTWSLHFPDELAVRQSVGDFRPESSLRDPGALAWLTRDLGTESAKDIGWKLLGILAAIVVVWLLVRCCVRWGVGRVVLTVAVLSGCGLVLLLAFAPAVQSARENKSATAFKSEAKPKSVLSTSIPFRQGSADDAFVGGELEQSKDDKAAEANKATRRGEDGVNPFRIAKGSAFGGQPAGDKPGFLSPPPQVAPAPAPAKADLDKGARLSVAIDFKPPGGSSDRTFEYLGRSSGDASRPVLDVEFESLANRRTFCGALTAIVACLCWGLRRRSWRVKSMLAAIGLLGPLALIGVTPMVLKVWLDGIFFGTLCGIAIWLVYECVQTASTRGASTARSSPPSPIGAAGTALMLVAVLLGTSTPARADDAVAAQSKPSGIVAKRPQQALPTVIPYDPERAPLSADRVLLEQRAFLELWNRAHPERPLGTNPPQDAFVTEARYTARLVPGASADRGHVALAGHIVLHSLVDHTVRVELPFQGAALRSAQLDGHPALLIPHPVATGEKVPSARYDVVLKSPGTFTLDVELDLPARVAGSSGEFTMHCLPVASGRLSLELPRDATSVRVTGSDAAFRRRTEGPKDWIDVPIASAGDLTIAWQPGQETAVSARSIESVGKTLLALDDSGLRIFSQFSLQIRQGGVTQLSFSLPPNAKLRDVRGNDVSGWKFESSGAARKLTVALRRNVTGSTRVELDLFQQVALGEAPTPVIAALPSPLEVVRETGIVALMAGPQFDVRTPALAGATQIDAREFDLAEFVASPALQAFRGRAIEAAFRYAGRPKSLESMVVRKSSQTDVSALHAILVGRRKLTLSSRFHIEPTGVGLTRADLKIPAGYLPLSVEGLPVSDWYTSTGADGKSLIVEFGMPQSTAFDLVVNGTVAKTPDDSKISLNVPGFSAARRAETHLAVWLDKSYQATIGDMADWKSISPEQTPAPMKSLAATVPQFAFETRRPQPAAISLNLTHGVPRLAGDSATIVTVTDAAVFYTVALQWKISQATADTFVLTMPDWLASRLDWTDPAAVSAANPRRRQTISTALGNGRVRWTIELQDPVADQLFLTATAVLPLPSDGKVLAPTLGFASDETVANEHRLEPLATQRHFVVLVNQSSAQLSDAPANPIEPVDRSSLPIQLDGNLLKQAMLVGRLTRTDAVAAWRIDHPAVRRGAAAFVNLADLVTVVEPGGTWRTQAIYRVKNLSRQFLAVETPEHSEILAVTVQNKAARPVQANVKGKALNLIPLPEVSEGDLSFEVRMIVAGRLPAGPLPAGAKLLGEDVPLPVPQVVTWENDADYGIPVARTRWTVWFPEDQQLRVLSGNQQTNLEQVNDETANSIERSAIVDEAKQLLSVLDSSASGNSRYQANENLKRLEYHLQDDVGYFPSKEPTLDAERRELESVRQQIADVRRDLQVDQRTHQAGNALQQQGEALTPQAQSAQADALNRLNESQSAKEEKPREEVDLLFGFRSESKSGGDKKSAPNQMNLARRRAVRSGEKSDKDEAQAEPKSPAELEKQLEGGKEAFGQPQSRTSHTIRNAPASDKPSAAPPASPGDQKSEVTLGARLNGEPARPHSPGTLSLAFDIPQEGQKLVLTKAGGDPKLTIEVRPRRSLDLLLGALWMLPWVALLILVLLLLGRDRYSAGAWRQLPFALMMLGVLLFVFLPAPAFWLGLLVIAAGTILASLPRRRQSVSR
jgi:hypothetical protein